MEVRNCKGCGRLFNYLQGPRLCPACVKKLEEKFTQVKQYIYDHPDASIPQISKDNEVSSRQIEQWVREERLYFSDDSPYGLACESCGKTIKTGRFCDACKTNMANTFQNAYKKPEAPKPESSKTRERDKMRYLD